MLAPLPHPRTFWGRAVPWDSN